MAHEFTKKHTKKLRDSSEKDNNLLHFCLISVLIKLILSGKAKLSMSSCINIKVIPVVFRKATKKREICLDEPSISLPSNNNEFTQLWGKNMPPVCRAFEQKNMLLFI